MDNVFHTNYERTERLFMILYYILNERKWNNQQTRKYITIGHIIIIPSIKLNI